MRENGSTTLLTDETTRQHIELALEYAQSRHPAESYITDAIVGSADFADTVMDAAHKAADKVVQEPKKVIAAGTLAITLSTGAAMVANATPAAAETVVGRRGNVEVVIPSKGDTDFGLTHERGLGTGAMRNLDGSPLPNRNLIKTNQKYLIVHPSQSPSQSAAAANRQYDTLKSGETLWSESVEHHVPITVIETNNPGLAAHPNSLPVGTKVDVTPETETSQAAVIKGTVLVPKGSSHADIAEVVNEVTGIPIKKIETEVFAHGGKVLHPEQHVFLRELQDPVVQAKVQAAVNARHGLAAPAPSRSVSPPAPPNAAPAPPSAPKQVEAAPAPPNQLSAEAGFTIMTNKQLTYRQVENIRNNPITDQERQDAAAGKITRLYDLRTPSGLTAEQIEQLLPPAMKGQGQNIINAGQQHHVNELLFIAAARVESNGGTSEIARDKGNLYGMNAFDNCAYDCATRFDNFAASIQAFATQEDGKYLSSSGTWYTGGTTLANMYIFYSTSGQVEAKLVAGIMEELREQVQPTKEQIAAFAKAVEKNQAEQRAKFFQAVEQHEFLVGLAKRKIVDTALTFKGDSGYANDAYVAAGGSADCEHFVDKVLATSGIDPDFPADGTWNEQPYLEHSPKWQPVQVSSVADLQPGDVLVVNGDRGGHGGDGHTFIYVGPQADGTNTVSASGGNHPKYPHGSRAILADDRGPYQVFRFRG